MGRFQNLYIQAFYIVLVSVITSLLFNQVRESPLSFVKKKVEVVSVLKSTSTINSKPSIIGIDLELAKKLFEEALLLQESGCFAMVLEGVPTVVAQSISEKFNNTNNWHRCWKVYRWASPCDP